MDAKNTWPTAETVAKLCLDKCKDLPKTGKPTEKQWTVLAGVVINNALNNYNKVVSLGLGTKCIGGSKMCPKGLIVNDSHAEVLARRGLMRYLYQHIMEAAKNGNESSAASTSIIMWNKEKNLYEIKPEYSFHFYSSQSPCGDACIIDDTAADDEGEIPCKLPKLSEATNTIGNALISTSTTITQVYTGGKLLNAGGDDRMAQTAGALRLKPGKGDRTLSMSCSDKLSKWCFMGVQGSLIYALMEKFIYFSSMTFNHGSDLNALKRAIFLRWKDKHEKLNYEPEIRICNESVTFGYAAQRQEDCLQPCPNGLVWCDVPDNLKPCEAIVNGKRQGCTKKALGTVEAAVKITKYHLFTDFVNIFKYNRVFLDKYNLKDYDLQTLKYCDAKNLSKSYQTFWLILKNEIFGVWSQKPMKLMEFSLSSSNEHSRNVEII